jgi:multimeric flavodoxin WrbA
MQAIAINASPVMDEGNTAAILAPFLDGMREAGAEVQVYYTKKLNIKPCQGEFDCWFKTPGKCSQEDDMEMLLPRLAEADIQVFATPLYADGMTGPLKNLLDRATPLGYPRFELRDGRCCLPQREGSGTGKVVLVSNCGYWEMDCFWRPEALRSTTCSRQPGRLAVSWSRKARCRAKPWLLSAVHFCRWRRTCRP